MCIHLVLTKVWLYQTSWKRLNCHFERFRRFERWPLIRASRRQLSEAFTVAIQPLLTRFIKPSFGFTLPPTQHHSFLKKLEIHLVFKPFLKSIISWKLKLKLSISWANHGDLGSQLERFKHDNPSWEITVAPFYFGCSVIGLSVENSLLHWIQTLQRFRGLWDRRGLLFGHGRTTLLSSTEQCGMIR